MRIDLPGWKTTIDEVSNGVFKVTLIDNEGRKAEIVDNATNETINKAIGFAFDIEKQVTKNWNRFLFELCLIRYKNQSILKQEFSDKAFDSWFIEFENERIVYDGKDSWLVLQEKLNKEWSDKTIIKNSEITYELLTMTLNRFK